MPPKAAPASVPEAQTAGHIASVIQAFLAEHPHSLVLEDGRTLFDLREAKYSLSADRGRATIHLWSADRNLVRRLLAVTPRAHTLRLTTQRLGQSRLQTLELTPDKHLRSPSTRDTTRQRFLRVLDRVLLQAFPDCRSEGFRSSMDLERSFGPGYARGTLTHGRQAWAVIAVNPAESQTTIDGILTIGILWLRHCRDRATSPAPARKTRLYQGLRVIVPRGAAATTLSRLAWLDRRIATYELFELDEQTEVLTPRDPSDHGNLTTRLLHAPSEAAAWERFAEAIPEVLALLPPNTTTFGLNNLPTRLNHPSISRVAHPLQPDRKAWIPAPKSPCQTAIASFPPESPHPTPPSKRRVPHSSQPHRDGWVAATEHSNQTSWVPAPTPSPQPQIPAHRNSTPAPTTPACELRLRSNTELAFLLHGLEFARIRSAFAGQSFNRQLQITVGSGPAETLLLPSTQTHLRELVRHLFDRRKARAEAPSQPTPKAAPNTAQDHLFRTLPERWLESTLRADLPALDPSLQPAPVYTQVPAFTGAGANLDRGLLDLLAVTRDNRLALIELKATEDLHLAFQGLDYWIRVRHHHLANPDPASGSLPGLSDLQQHGYFPHTRLSPAPPHLFLVAPALHIHPATETILRHLDPRVPWTLIALDERWRTHIKPIWRKRHSDL